jgi:hypothetical protein
MVRPMYDFIALHRIPEHGPAAYQRGDDVTADGVERWHLIIGDDIIPARPNVVPRPADDATRSHWEAYALSRGADPADLDNMTATDIRERYPDDAEPEKFVRLEDKPDRLNPVDPSVVTEQGRRLPPDPDRTERTPDEAVATGVNAVNVPTESAAEGERPARPATSATKAEWVDYAVSQGSSRDEAEAATKADLINAYSD